MRYRSTPLQSTWSSPGQYAFHDPDVLIRWAQNTKMQLPPVSRVAPVAANTARTLRQALANAVSPPVPTPPWKVAQNGLWSPFISMNSRKITGTPSTFSPSAVRCQ